MSGSTPESTLSGGALSHYGGKLRVRVGALLADRSRGRVLLVEHDALWREHGENASGTAKSGDSGAEHEADTFWTPPGGGVEFGEGLREALVREVEEETGLRVGVGALRDVLDFVRPPLHAVSFYFECALPEGASETARLGTDPELGADQMLRGVEWVPLDTLASRRVYPEPFRQRLAADLRAGFPEGTVYLGTFR